MSKNKLTKKEARQQRADYRKALAEGRVVRYGVAGETARTFRTFATREEALAFANLVRNTPDIEVAVLEVPQS